MRDLPNRTRSEARAILIGSTVFWGLGTVFISAMPAASDTNAQAPGWVFPLFFIAFPMGAWALLGGVYHVGLRKRGLSIRSLMWPFGGAPRMRVAEGLRLWLDALATLLPQYFIRCARALGWPPVVVVIPYATLAVALTAAVGHG